MSIEIRDLSDELIVQITGVLARRPEYGIAIPSRRWLQRQEEKIKQLPKELSRPSGLRRLAIKIADRIDPNIVDPQAILCQTHSRLNPFLIRRLFIALAYEVTVHTDSLRSWPGRTSDPELSALVGRLDSITALWTEPRLFQEIYGLTPFDGHHIFVKSSCEACCLAAVGASGRALADLRTVLIDRMERRSARPSGNKPRLHRVVEAWIDHLREKRGDIGRAEECRALSEALLIRLRVARPQILAWRAEQRRQRAAQRPIYAELRRSRAGAEITPLPASAGHTRRTRNGVPIALTDVEGAEAQRRAAAQGSRAKSIYRPDSLAPHSEVDMRQRATRAAPTGDVEPTQSQVKQETSMEDDRGFNDDLEDQELEDDAHTERSRATVQNWWANLLSQSRLDLGQDDAKSMLSMVHPAFRPTTSSIAPSTLPGPVPTNDGEQQAEASGEQYQGARSAWTDCSVQSLQSPSSIRLDSKNVPPVPRIPSEHRPSSSETSEPRVNWPAPPEGRSFPPRPGASAGHSAQESASRPSLSTSTTASTITPTTVPTTARSAHTQSHSIAASSNYDRGSVTTISNVASFHHPLRRDMAKPGPRDGNATPTSRSRAGSVPQPATVEDEVVPDDSVSSVNGNRRNNRRPSSTITRFSDFQGKM
ncbi:hypothetical protein GGR51DRAFT_89400 [Nemania sp. FL0031]|nr:hypothetical protein GGR51DRAFT_89400 [Nemania sp. FL0031]